MIFVSYRRSDSEAVIGRIRLELLKYFTDDEVFVDHDSIPIGSTFSEVIKTRLSQSKIALVLIGPTWFSVVDANGNRRLDDPNDFVRLEVEGALANSRVTVIPVLVMRAAIEPSNVLSLPSTLQPLFAKQGEIIRPLPDEHSDLERLVRKIQTICHSSTMGQSEQGIAKRDYPNAKYWATLLALSMFLIVAVLTSRLLPTAPKLSDLPKIDYSLPADFPFVSPADQPSTPDKELVMGYSPKYSEGKVQLSCVNETPCDWWMLLYDCQLGYSGHPNPWISFQLPVGQTEQLDARPDGSGWYVAYVFHPDLPSPLWLHSINVRDAKRTELFIRASEGCLQRDAQTCLQTELRQH